jgi:hypothetical protein
MLVVTKEIYTLSHSCDIAPKHIDDKGQNEHAYDVLSVYTYVHEIY